MLRYTADTLASLVSGLGTGRDKAATTYYSLPTLSAGELVTMYRASWLARKIVTIPALDATRKWRAWQTDYPTIEAIEKEEKRLDVQRKVLAAKTKARLYGAAALYIGTGDQTPALPLIPERIGRGGIRFLNVMSQSDLNPGEIEGNPESPYYGTPGWYELRLRNSIAGEIVRIHPSRLALFVGEPIPDSESVPATTTGTNWGTGDSVLMSVFEAIRQADSVVANVASLVFEAKVDVVRIPDLMANLTEPGFASRLLERFSLASTAKGINGTLLLDKEEEYEVKSPAMNGLPELITRFLEIVSGAADIPVTRLLGQSPGGLNSTGEGDLRNYYDRVQAMQQLEIGPAISILDECLIRSRDRGARRVRSITPGRRSGRSARRNAPRSARSTPTRSTC